MLLIRTTEFGVFVAYGVALLALGANGWRPFKIIITNHTIESYSPKCRVNASFTESGTTFNLFVEFLSNIRKPFTHTELYFESYDGKYDMEVVNRTIDMCRFYKNKRYEPIVQVIYKLFDSFLTHWARSCPMNQGIYYLQNVKLNVEKLPPFFPEKNGFYNALILDKQEKLFRIKVFFQILKTQIDTLKAGKGLVLCEQLQRQKYMMCSGNCLNVMK